MFLSIRDPMRFLVFLCEEQSKNRPLVNAWSLAPRFQWASLDKLFQGEPVFIPAASVRLTDVPRENQFIPLTLISTNFPSV